MSRIICVTGWFRGTLRGIETGAPRLLVSHGIDEHTGLTVILPNEHPSTLGARLDPVLMEWVIDSGTEGTDPKGSDKP